MSSEVASSCAPCSTSLIPAAATTSPSAATRPATTSSSAPRVRSLAPRTTDARPAAAASAAAAATSIPATTRAVPSIASASAAVRASSAVCLRAGLARALVGAFVLALVAALGRAPWPRRPWPRRRRLGRWPSPPSRPCAVAFVAALAAALAFAGRLPLDRRLRCHDRSLLSPTPSSRAWRGT